MSRLRSHSWLHGRASIRNQIVLASWGRHDKVPQTGGLKQQIFILSAPKARSPKSILGWRQCLGGSLCFCRHMASPVCLCPNLRPHTGTPVIACRATLPEYDLILVTSQRHSFQGRPYSQPLGLGPEQTPDTIVQENRLHFLCASHFYKREQ